MSPKYSSILVSKALTPPKSSTSASTILAVSAPDTPPVAPPIIFWPAMPINLGKKAPLSLPPM